MTTSTKLTSTWTAPSNIALIKYWGKKDFQLPCNPSLSMTLAKSYSKTSISLVEKKDEEIAFFLEGKEEQSFIPKISKLLSHLPEEWSFIKDYSLEVRSENSFPHSTGIASSASGMAALALCLCELKSKVKEEQFSLEEASEVARMGSGSACRSLFPKYSQWGKDESTGHDHFGIEYTGVNDYFNNFRDSILIVSSEKKSVSSSVGHKLLENHPYAQSRFDQARQNLKKLKVVMDTTNFSAFAEIVEEEALSLHGMMMTSRPSYLLMKPNTLTLIEKIRKYRSEGLDICFTLDAGPNIHLLYPDKIKTEVGKIIDTDLNQFCENGHWIDDHIGLGPIKGESPRE